jgi:hypothetical protein
MNSRPIPTRRLIAGLACLALVAATPAPEHDAGAERVRLVLRAGSTLRLDGDSNLRRWSCRAEELIPELTLFRADPSQPPIRVEEATMRVPVARIECGIGKMNENLRDALRADAHPEITFEVTRARVHDGVSRGNVTVTAHGRLTVAGVTKELDLDVTGLDTGDGALRLTSEVRILMTDFGVEPPTAMLGLLKTRNEVTIRFDLLADYESVEEAVSGDNHARS